MDLSAPFLAILICLVLVAAGLWPLTRFLRRRAILDIPVDRSSHTVPTPKGAGLLIIPVCLLTWLALVPSAVILPVVVAAGVLMLASWLDDVRELSPLLRLGLHLVAAAFGMLAIPDTMLVFQGTIPFAFDRLLAILLWVWFINLFNFMDGIDGISLTETLVIGGGLLILCALPAEGTILAGALVGCALGFLPWNWHPARIFLGDAGSAPLGYLLGYLLLLAAAHGHWPIALILPGYYLADSGLTLLRRLVRGAKVWQAHREHAYQHAAQNVGHRRSSILVAVVGILLVVTAHVSLSLNPVIMLAIAVGISIAAYLALLALGRR